MEAIAKGRGRHLAEEIYEVVRRAQEGYGWENVSILVYEGSGVTAELEAALKRLGEPPWSPEGT
jgi:hypothetical protein